MNEEVLTKPRRSRTTTRWLADKITVTEIKEDGFPAKKNGKRRMHRLAGLVACQQLPLVLDSIKSLTEEDKGRLFDKYCLPKLEFPKGMRYLAKKQFMKLIAKSFRTYKSHLVCNYVAKGRLPFDRHKHLKPKQWEDFVMLKSIDEFKAQSGYYKAIWQKNAHNHCLGTSGYNGKIEQ